MVCHGNDISRRWRIGDGTEINIWHQPWVRSTASPLVTSPPVMGTEQWTVSNLVDHQTRTWKHDVVSSIFNVHDATNILKMPLPCSQSEDKPIWHLSRTGTYTVKSAYYGVMENLVNSDHLKIQGDWMSVWRLKVPPKVKLLTWRILRGVLPTRSRLNRKGVDCPSFCQFCEHGEENDWHVFIGCDHAMRVWQSAGLDQLILSKIQQGVDLKNTIFSILASVTQVQKNDFVMLLWCLWKRRNDKVWLGEEKDVSTAIMLARQALLDWELAKAKEDRRGSSTQHQQQTVEATHSVVQQQSLATRWNKPSLGALKCNVDAAIFSDQQRFGVGLCIRNHLGEPIHAKSMVFDGNIPASEAEARGLWEALSWVGMLGYSHMLFELDCKFVVDSIRGDTQCQLEVGAVIKSCKEKLSQSPNYVVSFIRRQANFVAHALARVAQFNASHRDYDYVPACVFDIILNEMK